MSGIFLSYHANTVARGSGKMPGTVLSTGVEVWPVRTVALSSG